MNRSFSRSGLKHNKREYKTKSTSPIQEKCSCGSGSFLMRKEKGNKNWFCRVCGKKIKGGSQCSTAQL